jgi:hypothetical protein
MCTTVPIHKKMYTTVHINNKAVQQYEKTSLHNSVNKQQLWGFYVLGWLKSYYTVTGKKLISQLPQANDNHTM